MKRAIETANIIAQEASCERHVVPELRELDFGRMEGLTDSEIAIGFAEFKHQQSRALYDIRYPGGETAGEVQTRAVSALEQLSDTCGGTVLIVTHGVVIRSLVAAAIGAPIVSWRRVATRLENTSITEIDFDPRGGIFSLERLNDYAHLTPHPHLLRAAWGVDEN